MLLVILGAGASYGSTTLPARVPLLPDSERPPLAKELFDNRPAFGSWLLRYKQVAPVANELRRVVARGESLELALEVMQEEAESWPQRAVQLAALRWYLWAIIRDIGSEWLGKQHGVTNYAELVSRIERWRFPLHENVVYVSFNYDILLEDSLTRALDRDFSTISDYLPSNSEKTWVFKPHGSVNWAERIPHAQMADRTGQPVSDFSQESIRRVQQIRATGDFVVTTQQGNWDDSGYFLPAIAIPVQSKFSFVCPADHLTVMKQLLPHVDRVLIIGWRAMEQHFLELWSSVRQRQPEALAIANGSTRECDETVAQLSRSGITTGPSLRVDSFSALLEDTRLEAFLGS